MCCIVTGKYSVSAHVTQTHQSLHFCKRRIYGDINYFLPNCKCCRFVKTLRSFKTGLRIWNFCGDLANKSWEKNPSIPSLFNGRNQKQIRWMAKYERMNLSSRSGACSRSGVYLVFKRRIGQRPLFGDHSPCAFTSCARLGDISEDKGL